MQVNMWDTMEEKMAALSFDSTMAALSFDSMIA